MFMVVVSVRVCVHGGCECTCVFMVAVSVHVCVHGGCECTCVCSWWL